MQALGSRRSSREFTPPGRPLSAPLLAPPLFQRSKVIPLNQTCSLRVGLLTEARRISKNPSDPPSKEPIAPLRDGDQPFIFDVQVKDGPYRLEFYDTACPENWTLLTPSVVILCYDISSRLSLINIQRFVRSIIFLPAISKPHAHCSG
jgi:hypothetical protein